MRPEPDQIRQCVRPRVEAVPDAVEFGFLGVVEGVGQAEFAKDSFQPFAMNIVDLGPAPFT